jgi:NAD(P)H-hydrate epimerase
MRGGAGIVWAAVPDPVALALDIAVPEVQFRGMIADEDGRITVAAAQRLEALVADVDTVVFGPGIGDSDQTRALARWAAKSDSALVLDAQGLIAFENDLGVLAARDGNQTLLTPHEGELARLLNVPVDQVKAHRLESAQAAAAISRSVVLLKGEDTIICDPSGRFLVARGHVAQATAGTGDVLSGVASALLARGLPALLAGACAALGCSRAAEKAASDLAREGVVASDLLLRIPAALAPDMGGGGQ